MTTKEKREKRAKAIADARALFATAETESRAMTTEESTAFDAHMADADTMKADIDRIEALETAEADATRSRRIIPATVTGDADAELRSWLLGNGAREFTFNLASKAMRQNEEIRDWQSRAQSTVGASGGHTISPEFSGELEKALLAFGGVRNVARVIRTSTGAALPFPTLDDTTAEGRILAEGAAAATEDMTFGSVSVGAHKFTSDLVIVSRELLEDTAIDLASEVGGALGTRIGRITNRLFTVGTGVAQPQGIVTAATLGVTAASTTLISYDELIDLEHSVDSAYRMGAKFVLSDGALKVIKKLKDLDGRPIWTAGLASGAPDTILGYSYVVNPHMSAPAASAVPVLFGATDKFLVRDVRDIRLYRLEERYAEVDSTGFVAFSRHDSRMIDAGTSPVKKLVMAAA